MVLRTWDGPSNPIGPTGIQMAGRSLTLVEVGKLSTCRDICTTHLRFQTPNQLRSAFAAIPHVPRRCPGAGS